MKLLNKTAIVTGGAQGIGFSTVRKFLEEGANVVAIDYNVDKTKRAIKDLKEYRNKIEFIVGDITDENFIEKLVKDTVKRLGNIDILVNNAGITADAQLLKMKEEEWDKVINVNLKSVFVISKYVASIMKEGKKGIILNASSVVGINGNFGQTNYAATKAGINAMTKTWAKELGKYNIRVNSVAPGFILTEMTKEMPENILNAMKEKSLLNQLGTPDDIANAYCFLASKDASFITGTVLNVDGGVVI